MIVILSLNYFNWASIAIETGNTVRVMLLKIALAIWTVYK